MSSIFRSSKMRGREDLVERLDALLRASAAGRAGLLVVEGEPGSGKTTVASEAARRGVRLGFKVVEIATHEGEADLSLAGLSMLLRPLMGKLPALTAGQRRAVRAATGACDDAAVDRFALGAATLALLSATAEQGPLLLVVDDGQWLDDSSAAALAFAVRRLAADPVLVLVTARQNASVLASVPEAHRVFLASMPDDDIAEILRDAGLSATTKVVSEIAASTGGLPLAVLETARRLSVEQRRGDTALPEPLPIAEQVLQRYREQLASLPRDTQRVLVLVALAGSTPGSALTAAMKALDMSIRDLGPAEEAGAISVEEGMIVFAHPLLRAAALTLGTAAVRRTMHRELAQLAGGNLERRAHHLAAAAIHPDDDAANALASAAEAVRERSGLAVAAPTLARAAQFTAPGEIRCDRLLAAGRALIVAGCPNDALRLSREAMVETRDPVRRADATAVLASAGIWGADGMEALCTATDAAEQMASVDRIRAIQALSQAFMAAMTQGIGTAACLQLAERAIALLEDGMPDEVQELARNLHVIALVVAGRALEAEPYFDRWQIPKPQDISTGDLRGFRFSGMIQALVSLGRLPTASNLVRVLLAACSREAAPAAKAHVLGFATDLYWWRGDWTRAVAFGEEATSLAEQTGQPALAMYTRAVTARVLAGRGDEARCRDHAELARDEARADGRHPVLIYCNAALGALELGRGDVGIAAKHLLEADAKRRALELKDPVTVPFGPDLIEALMRAGRTDEAHAALRDHSALAAASGSKWALGAVARCRGLLEHNSDEADRNFRFALEINPPDLPFEEARTKFCWGEHLRRRRDLVHSRSLLREARDRFEQLGARPWVTRADAELGAAGERPRSHESSPTSALTSQELRCALAVADGMSNREAANALFLSQKTVEYHLHKVYNKLGVRSRTQLARTLHTHSENRALNPARL